MRRRPLPARPGLRVLVVGIGLMLAALLVLLPAAWARRGIQIARFNATVSGTFTSTGESTDTECHWLDDDQISHIFTKNETVKDRTVFSSRSSGIVGQITRSAFLYRISSRSGLILPDDPFGSDCRGVDGQPYWTKLIPPPTAVSKDQAVQETGQEDRPAWCRKNERPSGEPRRPVHLGVVLASQLHDHPEAPQALKRP